MSFSTYDDHMDFLRRIFTVVWKSEALRQSAVMTIGNLSTGVIMAGAMIIASRALGPENFGVFSVSIAVMSVLVKGVDLGLNQLIPRLLNNWHNDQKRQNEFLGQIVYWKIILLAGTLAFSILLLPVIQNILRYPHPDMLLWAILGVIGMSLFEYVAMILAARHTFTWIAVMNIGQAVLKATGFFIIFLLGIRSADSIAGVYYLAPLISAAAVSWSFKKLVFVTPKNASIAVRTDIFRFLGHASVGVVAMTLISNIDVLLVQRYLNAFDTGLYAGATRIAGFVGFLTASIGGVLNNRVSRYKDKATLRQYLLKSLGLVAVALCGFLVFLPFSRYAVLYTIGPEYLESVFTLNILVLNTFLSLAIVPYISFFYAVDHPNYFSFGGIIQVLIIGLGSWWFLPKYGIEAAAWTKVAASAASGVYTALYLWYAYTKIAKKQE